jgi:S1-C subfamily serine protease
MQPVRGGLVILSVEPDGPAALAGLMVGDVLVSLDGHAIEHPDQVLDLLGGDVVGRTLKVELMRGGKQERVDLLVAERPRRAK